MTRSRTLVLLLATGGMLVPTAAPAEDLIIRKGGKTTRVFQVTRATFSNVSFILKEGLQEQTIPRANVWRIRFGDTPPAYTAGMDFLRKGEFARAIKAFKEARTDPNVRTWWASVWCRLQLARAYLDWARQSRSQGRDRAAEAVKIVGTVTAEYPDNFFKPDFQVLHIESLIAAGEPRKAKDEAEAFEQAVSGWADKTWYMRAKLLGADAMLAAKLYTEAVSKLDTLITFATSNNFPDWAAKAQIRKARAILEQGDKDRAVQAFKELVDKIDDSWSHRAAAAAYIGLGQVLLQHFNKPDQAREYLLTARVVYFGTDKKDSEVMAEAAYWLGRTAEALAAQGESGAKIEAKRYYMEIRDQYKSTSWAAKAAKRLKGLGG